MNVNGSDRFLWDELESLRAEFAKKTTADEGEEERQTAERRREYAKSLIDSADLPQGALQLRRSQKDFAAALWERLPGDLVSATTWFVAPTRELMSIVAVELAHRRAERMLATKHIYAFRFAQGLWARSSAARAEYFDAYAQAPMLIMAAIGKLNNDAQREDLRALLLERWDAGLPTFLADTVKEHDQTRRALGDDLAETLDAALLRCQP